MRKERKRERRGELKTRRGETAEPKSRRQSVTSAVDSVHRDLG